MNTSLRYLAIIGLSGVLSVGVGCTPTQTTTQSNTAVDDTVEDGVDVVTEDAYGIDLTQVERYPDSLRSYYSKTEYEHAVTYQTTASISDVRKFYNDKLLAAGWSNSEDATDAMEYVKGDEENPEILTIYFTDYKAQNLVEYELVYEPPLSAEDLDSTELDEDSF